MRNVILALVVAMAISPVAEAGKVMRGKASWYDCRQAGQCSKHKITAQGEKFNPNLLTAAHRTLKLGTVVRVTNMKNGKSVVVRINDRGPAIKSRIIDLSRAAARRIGIAGVGDVKIEVMKRGG